MGVTARLMQFPVFVMEQGPPRWFYVLSDRDQLELHLVEFEDIANEFTYWNGAGNPIAFSKL